MRKQTKILVATALLALGASFTSMAAAKTGTWMLEDDGWYCYDKEGEAWEDEFCLSYGKEYYMGDDGLMVTNSWVEHDDEVYFVGSDGSKTISDWRYLVPEDSDEEEAEWFYFDAKGRMVDSVKKVIDGKTYYFNDNGYMLTGWVDTVGFDNAEVMNNETVVWCNEDGARESKVWIKTWAPEVDEDDQEDDNQNWYWIKSKGGVQTGRNLDINDETYFFGEDGKMLSGWVATADGETYKAIGYKNSEEELSDYTEEDCAVYFCGGSNEGWAKKDKWIKTWKPSLYNAADSDKDQNWFWIAKSGKVYIPTATESNAYDVTFDDGSAAEAFATDSDAADIAVQKEINDKIYAFNMNGEMWSGLVEVDGVNYYYGDAEDGSMKTGSVVIEDEEGVEWKFFFGKKNDTEDGYKKGAAVTGAASGELYVNGLIQVADDADYEEKFVNGYYFVVDADGDIRTAKKEYENEDGKVYLDTTADNVTFTGLDGVNKGSYYTTAVK